SNANFQNLAEIQSIEKYIKNHLDKIASEQSRIKTIKQQVNSKSEENIQKKSQLAIFQNKLNIFEKDLFASENQLEKSNKHLLSATDQKQAELLEQEISNSQKNIERLENEILELMDKVENIEVEISDNTGFINGASSTIDDITREVESTVIQEEKEIKQYEQRIELLLNETNSEFANVFTEINKKLRFNNPLAFIKNSVCGQCRFSIDQMTLNEIEQHFLLQTCEGCGRILVPHLNLR
ncbi:MAG: hypothetical protein HOJ35_00980, partial [Bdellovibrionales bacterium]|nr:hypothetical protein [Bdellovibrionales bacterium]